MNALRVARSCLILALLCGGAGTVALAAEPASESAEPQPLSDEDQVEIYCSHDTPFEWEIVVDGVKYKHKATYDYPGDRERRVYVPANN